MDKRYELREKIGQGGIGTVYRSYDHNLKREVAIKRILGSEDDPALKHEAAKQLMVEAGALASLQHPNIVIIQDVGFDEEGPYVVMELINGKTLDEIIESAPLAWNDCKQVAMQSLEALIAAQELNMIHSDLKPPNIMLTWLPSGTFQVKVLDFGLAVLIHNQSHEEIEKMESMFGSIFFMPPEQFERKVLDARSDLYSLGCCFYQALTGNYPFDGTTGEEVMVAHLNHTVTPIEEICGDIPIWACQWIMWLINRNPDDRPNSAREALANFIRNDDQENSALSQGGAQVISPTPIVSSAFAEATPKVFSAKLATSSVAQASSLQPVGGEGDALGTNPEVQRKSIPQKRSKIHLKIAAAAVLLLLIVSLFWMVKGRNDRIRRAYTYDYLVTAAADDKVKEIPMSGADLQIVLESIRNSKPNVDLKHAYRALAVAKANDATNIGTTIADFATTADFPDPIRQNLFEKVIGERDDEAVVPTLIQFSASASNPDEAVSAIRAISKMAQDKHAEGLLGVLSSASQPKVRDAAEALLQAIIRNSENRTDLAQLISNKAKQNDNQASSQAMDRLMAFSKPQTQASIEPNPAPNPNPNPNPTPKPQTGATGEIKPFVDALKGTDGFKKIDALKALGESSNVSAHAILLGYADETDDSPNQRRLAIQAAIQLNSSPAMINDENQARQRWVQISWVAKSPEEEKLVIDAISAIQTDWATSILERMAQYSKNTATQDLAQEALKDIAERGKP